MKEGLRLQAFTTRCCRPVVKKFSSQQYKQICDNSYNASGL